MAADSGNNNSSNWVTARHGGDGKGAMVKKPAVVNHHGAVNGQKGPRQMTAPHPGNTQQAQDAGHAADGDEENKQHGEEKTKSAIPDYIATIAGHLRAQHGLTHNHSVRVAAAITKKHADGHAQVDDTTKQAAATAHAEFTANMGKAKAASPGGK